MNKSGNIKVTLINISLTYSMLLDAKFWTSNTPKGSYARILNKIKYIFNACDLKVKRGRKESYIKLFIGNITNVRREF